MPDTLIQAILRLLVVQASSLLVRQPAGSPVFVTPLSLKGGVSTTPGAESAGGLAHSKSWRTGWGAGLDAKRAGRRRESPGTAVLPLAESRGRLAA